MKKRWIILVVILLLIFLVFVIFYNPKDSSASKQNYCLSAKDCSPATCCHPSEVVNKDYAPDCSGAFCSQECSGPLDCNMGRIDCIDNECKIIPQ
jgi:hypothetical protein